ncbi:hypothetical protein GQ600_18883 [Phytophthora cactorum]|nr:hypothetical protein GQ600_18883 [Phytophthora cactorum]
MALLLRSVTSVSAKRATVRTGRRGRGLIECAWLRVQEGQEEGQKGRRRWQLRADAAEEWTEEEKQSHQEIGRRYNTMSTIEHNHFMRDVQTKIDLKWDAINALPAELQAEALEIDVSPVPEERGMATWTPPSRASGDTRTKEMRAWTKVFSKVPVAGYSRGYAGEAANRTRWRMQC